VELETKLNVSSCQQGNGVIEGNWAKEGTYILG